MNIYEGDEFCSSESSPCFLHMHSVLLLKDVEMVVTGQDGEGAGGGVKADAWGSGSAAPDRRVSFHTAEHHWWCARRLLQCHIKGYTAI